MKHADLTAHIARTYALPAASISGVEPPLLAFLVQANLKNLATVLVLPDKPSAERALNDIVALGLSQDVHFVGSDRVDGIDTGQSGRALRALLSASPGIYVTQAAELAGGLSGDALKSIVLQKGQDYSVTDLERGLFEYGFTQDAFVVEPGYYASRGGIFDVFPGDQNKPLRLDFFGNTLESIREFDPATQRSGVEHGEITIFPENPFLDTVVDPLINSVPVGVKFYQYRPIIEDSDSTTIAGLLGDERPGDVSWFYQSKPLAGHVHDIEIQPDFQRNLDAFRARLGHLNEENYRVYICADSNIQLDRLRVLFEDLRFESVRLSLSSGFIDHKNKLAVLTDHQIFGRTRKRSVIPRSFPVKPATRVEAFEEGDYVVHLDYGVGKYLGIELMPFQKTVREVLALEYEAGDRIYVPVEKMHRVHRYESQLETPPKLTRLRTTEWDQVKIKTRKAVDNYAKELIELYANRFIVEGFRYSPDNDFQKRMEASFMYDETSDQLKAVEDIKQDMEAAFPMDRLLCGDVGFGKTEVAMRAVFKAINDSKQVGVLVPTTILAQQHYETFLERFADYPVSVGVLSRFRTPKQIKQTLSDIEKGLLDVVIGTHRILSKDVVFNRLGLLIVDEEHRFGVKHKERVKEIKMSVDSLAMTATPIPRTLQMSLMGARDLSMLKTPPKERQPVETVVMDFDENRIREAILREVDRGGQVFFVHNRVESIGIMLSRLQKLLPEVKFGLGHGQMNPRTLERVMLGFFHKEFDVLLSTTIVESGLDIPNANTIIVNRADAMGLSQLYQLRGRVGRSHRKAWAFFVAPGFRKLSVNAIRRLNALERHAHYGGGYEIAMRDLEIRGSGNVFGTEQSGHISNIGYHLYTRILKDTLETLKEIKGDQAVVFPPPDISIDLEMQIPSNYVENTAERIASYRRIAEAETAGDIHGIREALRDRFGLLPPETINLIEAALVKKIGQSLGIRSIVVKGSRAQCDFLPEHVEQEGSEIIKALSKALGETGKKVEIMNNKSLTFIMTHTSDESLLASLRIFLESLQRSSKFSDHNDK
ncbi:MAG: transcription-repair coupling factor [Candidatus Marinimicrobia bacterium]|nr:transcription-repair coupling factor [Candidatus Neomarinimicrobiota bacterium]MBT3826113.1 transcription-repair coupling factor [Candidatus Neomarinimicrobiota bacterium]MBT4296634.1 transcription-repair coupling factor [Candidatus Neomarinimicrobiota bacterium]MBT4421287.1 transcription-repair coupling factor [Candidatus Neomarinimicrobiota bacterium]MBT5464911.1 transcription-repair coupling factor [Candidatus Neomarinimicrobiota bacterium]